MKTFFKENFASEAYKTALTGRKTTRKQELKALKIQGSQARREQKLQIRKNLSQNYEKNSCILHNIVLHYSYTEGNGEKKDPLLLVKIC